MNTLEKLYFTTITFRLKVTEKIILPSGLQKGYLLRQSLGNALHKTLGDYALEKFWNNTLNEEQYKTLKISREPPRGYIIEPPDTNKMVFNTDDLFEIKIILIGYVTEYADAFIDAFEFMGSNSGLGITVINGCGKFTIDQIFINGKKKRTKTKKAHVLYLTDLGKKEFKKGVKLNFITPAEIKISDNKRRLLLNDKKDIPYFFVSLHKRLNALEAVYCTGICNTVDYKEMFDSAEAVNLETGALERIRTKVAGKYLQGFRGEVLFTGSLENFNPSLLLGEYLHIGAETNYGFGKYEIVQ